VKAKVIDISSWEILPFSTKGTRDKCIVQSPDKIVFYFKASLKKKSKKSDGKTREYPYEFWSEIIACRIATLLGFEALQYDVAYRKTEDEFSVGCISQSMQSDAEALFFGYDLIIGFSPTFEETHKRNHRLPLICKTLEHHKLSEYRHKIIECLVLDAIIGNTDRHSENWAIISRYEDVKGNDSYSYMNESWNSSSLDPNDKIKEPLKKKKEKLVSLIKTERVAREGNIPNRKWDRQHARLAPIYDSGSSLGREYQDDKLKEMLEKDAALDKYIKGGHPDIQIKEGGTRRTFLECIEDLCQDYRDDMKCIFEQNISQIDSKQIDEMLDAVDQDAKGIIPMELCLSSTRKSFISRLVNKRIEYIKDIIRTYVPVS
jgi:hypothetical protein